MSDGATIRFTLPNGASFIRTFPTVTTEAALRYLAPDSFGLRDILRRAGHFTVGGSYEWLDTFPACKVASVSAEVDC